METVRTRDSGTLQYGLYFSDGQSECIVHESYRSSEALLLRLRRAPGDTSPELAKALADSKVRVYRPFLSL